MLRNKTLILVLIGALIVAVVIICYLLMKPSKVLPRPQVQYVEASPQKPPQSRPALVFFYAEWCGHSKQMLPSWKQASQVLRKSGVNVVEIESKQKQQIQENNVQGFPTLRLYTDGFPSQNYIEYKGNRTPESIINFVKSGGKSS